MKLVRISLPVALSALISVGCFEIEPPPDQVNGSIEGQIVIAERTASAARLDASEARVARAELGRALAGQGARADGREVSDLEITGRLLEERTFPTRKHTWRPGELIVMGEYRQVDMGALQSQLTRATLREELPVELRVERCVARFLCLVTAADAGGKPLEEGPTKALADRLHAARLEGVQAVAVNAFKYAMRVPNDEHFDKQWHYDFARIPQAWDITVGSPSVVVAVVDSGMNLSHPDALGRLLPGFDFITDPQIAIDGNGFDDDPTDPGDNAFGPGQHSFHGTHVAGIIGAATDNNQGVAGILWEGGIVPVRALGLQQSGTDFDILNGVFWAVGETDFGGEPIPPNNNPAKVVNLSLGGPSDAQGQALWEGTIEVITVGDIERYNEPIFVVAAGNEAQNANVVTPANIPGVITVGATQLDGTLADYSNFGPSIDVMAPGGELGLDQDGDGFGDGILSLFANAFEFEQGTSFAAPHVAGVVGLMLAIDPSLNQSGAEQLLRQSADPTGICGLGCGTGYVDALATLIAAGGVIQDRPQLAVDATRLIYQPTETQLQVRVVNIGSAPLDWQVSISQRNELWTATPSAGSTPAGGESTVNVTLDRQGNTSSNGALIFEGLNEASGQEVFVELFFNDSAAPPARNLQQVQVSALRVLDNGDVDDAGAAIASRAEGFAFRIEGLPPGTYQVFAVGDDNNDGVFDFQTESVGAWRSLAEVEDLVISADSPALTDVSFELAAGFAVGDGVVGASCGANVECGFAPDAECVAGFPGGYCSRECDDGFCGAGASCEQLDCDGTPCNVCLQRCFDDGDCRTGYVCDPFLTCTPEGF